MIRIQPDGNVASTYSPPLKNLSSRADQNEPKPTGVLRFNNNQQRSDLTAYQNAQIPQINIRPQVRELRVNKILQTTDILGAQPRIAQSRSSNTNPNQPQYQYPGYKELSKHEDILN